MNQFPVFTSSVGHKPKAHDFALLAHALPRLKHAAEVDMSPYTLIELNPSYNFHDRRALLALIRDLLPLGSELWPKLSLRVRNGQERSKIALRSLRYVEARLKEIRE